MDSCECPLKESAITYPWGHGPGQFFVKFKVDALPSTVVIDRRGQVRYVQTRMIPKDELGKAVHSAL